MPDFNEIENGRNIPQEKLREESAETQPTNTGEPKMLTETIEKLLQYIVTETIHCNGNKCRLSVCESCFPDADEAVERNVKMIAQVRTMLGEVAKCDEAHASQMKEIVELRELIRMIFESTPVYHPETCERGVCVFSDEVIEKWKELTHA
jgi:hypothetical protein